MDEDSLLVRGGLLVLLAVAVVGGVSHLLGVRSTTAQEDGGRTVAVVAKQAAAAGARPVVVAPATPAAPEAVAPGAPPCRVVQAARPLPATVHESSGVAVSRRHAGTFWTHNDSGDPVVYAVGAEGGVLGRTRVEGAAVQDWEDVAVGPCPGGECLFVGDIGDNEAARPYVTVYRVQEPAPGESRTRPAEAFHARYPDGPHDAEALFVLPSGEVYIITKGETGPIALYRLPRSARPGRTVELERVRDLTSGEVGRGERITGAGASPDGRWIAVRTLHTLFLHPTREFLAGGEHAARRMELAGLSEAQGEAVGFGAGDTLVLTSEGGKKRSPATFTRLACELR